MVLSILFTGLHDAFELYGIDFLICHSRNENERTRGRFTVKLLEINAEPAIEMTGERLRWILEDLFVLISRTFVAPFFNKEQASDPDDNCSLLRKCLDVNLGR